MALPEIPSVAVFKDGSYFTYDGESPGAAGITECVRSEVHTVDRGCGCPYSTTRCEVWSFIISHFNMTHFVTSQVGTPTRCMMGWGTPGVECDQRWAGVDLE